MSSKIEKRRFAALERGTDEYRQRRREITQAASRVFNSRGYHGTSMAAVAEASGIDRGSMYYYISSKDELFDEVVREVSEANVARAQAIRSAEAAAPDKLRMLIEDLMKSYGSSYPLLYIYIRENLSHTSDERAPWATHMRRLNRQYDDCVIGILEQGYSDGSLRYMGPAREVAYGILGMLGWTNRWFDPSKSEMTAQEIGTMYADIILSGLATRRPHRRTY